MTTTTKSGSIAGAAAEKIALKAAKSDMKKYAKLKGESSALKAQAKKKDEKAKDIEASLILFGERHKDQFEDNNLDLGPGYLHIAENTEVITPEDFDVVEFAEDFPDHVDMKLKVGELKKSWIDNDERSRIQEAGVDLKTEPNIEVKLNKK